MARPLIDPTGDPGGDPHQPPIRPPHGGGGGGAGGNGGDGGSPPVAAPQTVAETGNAVPIAYGTVRSGAQILERYPNNIGSQMTPWLGSHVYSVGDVRASNGNIYLCITAGTSFPSQYTAASALVVAGGSGYAVSDLITLAGGIPSVSTVLQVTGIAGGGVVTSVSVQTAGQYRTLPVGAPGQLSTSGSGTGATFAVAWNPAGGPFSTLADILDGTAHWKFLYTAKTGIGTATPWNPSTAYALNAVVTSNGNLYYCITAGTSSATGSVGNGPSAQNPDVTDGSVHWSFIQGGVIIPCVLGICEGTIYDLGQAWQDSQTLGQYSAIPHPSGQMLLAKGDGTGLVRPSWLPTPDATFADVYAQTALLALVYLSSSQDASMPNLSFEVAGVFADATHADVSPADITIDILTHTRRGIGWPSARVDAVSTGTGAASWRTYCTAYGLNLSLLLDSQSYVLQILAQMLMATNTDCVTTNRADGSGSMLKFVPRCDTALTANGVTFTPNLTATSIGPDDLLEPTHCTRRRPTDCLNSFPVEYVDRSQGYRRITVDDPEQADVDLRGLLRATTTSLAGIVMQPASAKMLAGIFAQRSLNVRNTWTLKLSWAKALLFDCADLLSVTDPVWGLVNYPMRITMIDEQNAADGTFTVTAEDFPSAVHVAPATVPQAAGPGTYQPQQQTPLGTAVLDTRNVPPQIITARSLTTSNFGNLFPNPTGESQPPAGANVANDGTNPEFDYLFNAGVGNAFGGAYVRRLLRTAAGTTTLVFRTPAITGESYTGAPWYQWMQTGGTPTGSLTLKALDASLATLQSATTSLPTGHTNWTSAVGGANPPSVYLLITNNATVWIQYELTLQTAGAGTAELWFDQMTFKRMVGRSDLDVLGTWFFVTASGGIANFQNGWTNVATGWQTAQFMLDAFGIAHLRGTISGPVAGTTAFQLPAAYLPPLQLQFPLYGGGGVLGQVVIAANGVVTINGATNVSLDGITYDTR